METVTISKDEYERMKQEVALLRSILKEKESEIDWDLVRQFDESLEDLKNGRFRKLA